MSGWITMWYSLGPSHCTQKLPDCSFVDVTGSAIMYNDTGTTVTFVVLEQFCVLNLSENKFNHPFGALHSADEYQLFQDFGKR